MSGILKNTVILSNYTEDEVFKRINQKYAIRLKRRTIWANVGSDGWLLKYVRPYFTEFKIEPELVLFHFWMNVLRLRANSEWYDSTKKQFFKSNESYFDFCKNNDFESKVGIDTVGEEAANGDSGRPTAKAQKGIKGSFGKVMTPKRIMQQIEIISDVE